MVVKVLIRQQRKRTQRNGNKSQRWHQRSRCQSSEALPVLGVAVSPNASHRAPAAPTCAFGSLANVISAVALGEMRSKGVSACTVTF